jgi:hypothetical protein
MKIRVHLLALTVAALVAAWMFVLEVDEPGFPVDRLLLVAGVGVVMVAVGVLADLDGERRVAVLVVLAGSAWLLERLLSAFHAQLVIAIGGLVASSWVALLAHAVLVFPGGRTASRLDRLTVAAVYAVCTGFQVLTMLTLPSFELRGGTGKNPLHLLGDATFAHRSGQVMDSVTAFVLAAFVAVVARRAVTATVAARRAYGFVWLGGIVLGANLVVLVIAGLGVVPFNDAYGLWLEIVAGAVRGPPPRRSGCVRPARRGAERAARS